VAPTDTMVDRFQQIEEIFHKALQRNPAERDAFVRDACQGDPTLHREVSSLLENHDEAGGGELWAASAAAQLMAARGSLDPGTSLGSYRIERFLAAGGMGEVYGAHDTKLGRQVAIKILPDSFTHDPERLARFRREAHVLAALNHPHIGAIYGLEEANGRQFLVLELIDGETLADRLTRGRLSVDDALAIARQIADALESAHEKGIVHRDLKPSNVALTHDGTVKVLDFGLAKITDAEDGSSVDRTIASPGMETGIGVILGTAAYMSPEQARGRTADKRSDIWAFGCVLYEMLTGKPAFGGDDVADTLAAVLRGAPDWTTVPAEVPRYVRTLLVQCLEKNRAARLADVAAVRFVLAHGATLERIPGTASAAANVTTSRWPPVLAWSVAATCTTALVLVLGLWPPWRQNPAPAPMRMSVELGTGISLANAETGAATVLSPDGTVVVFVGRTSGSRTSQLYVRRLDQLQAVPLAGTDDAQNPFFSPDGEWIAFFASGKLKKIAVRGGASVTLCEAPAGRGGAWGDDGTIVFSPNMSLATRLLRVASTGGTPVPLTSDSEAPQARWPQILPGGRAVLFTSSRTAADFSDADVMVQPLPSGAPKVVQRGGFYGRYVASGHLLYVHAGTLWAAPFDINRLAVSGPPVPVIEGVTSNAATGSALVDVSRGGTLVYLPGQGTSGVPIHWMDREGNTTPLRSAPANWTSIQFAPDGARLALQINPVGSGADIGVYEWTRDLFTRLLPDPGNRARPVWTPDGRRIVFGSTPGSQRTLNLYWQRADGVGDAQRLTESPYGHLPVSWHPSGKFLAFTELNPQTNFDLLVLPMAGDEASGWKPGKPIVFLNSRSDEREPVFSPDGRWIAYQSNESGRPEVYVRPYPGPGGKSQISTDGGVFPTWSKTAHELFFGTPTQQIMMAAYEVEGHAFRAEKPQLWSDARYQIRGPFRPFDLHPDGKRFALAPAAPGPGGARQDHVTVIFNVFDELRRIAPNR
jgi:serine/threonine protein kinase/Tol biopolymer transport system component